MNNAIIVFILRVVVGLVGGYALTFFFFTKGQPTPWFIVIVLACMVVAAAYISEAWRTRKPKK